MAVTYGFFNSVNGDRKYNAEQMSEYFRGIINEGVYQHLDGGLAVTAGTGLAVNVAAGRAIIQNRWVQNSAAMSLTIAAASETYARKDAVVIRLNWSSRSISIAVKTGTPAASPVAPSMTRNSTTYEMALAYVNVAANATSVTVTDKRSDSTVCGWVTVAQSTSGEVDAQLNDMKTGFDGVVYPTPGDAVRSCDQNLQVQIDIKADNVYGGTTSSSYLDVVNGSTWDTSTGTTSAMNIRARSNPILILPNMQSISIASGYLFCVVANNDGYGHPQTFIHDWNTSFDITTCIYKYIYIVIKRSDNGVITGDDLTSVLSIAKYTTVVPYVTTNDLATKLDGRYTEDSEKSTKYVII